MGSKNSKTDNKSRLERADSKRLSTRRMSKIQTVESIVTFVQLLKTEIKDYNGYREDERYKSIQKALAKYSQEIQILRSKKEQSKLYDYAQKEINIALRLLEEKVKENERKLDVAAVESHSFINQDLKQSNNNKRKIINNNRERLNKSYDTLDGIEEKANQIAEDVNKVINSGYNKNEIIVLEKKIHILYTQLEVIKAEPYTPLHERKESIGRQLIKYNNKLKKSNIKKETTSNERIANNSNELIRLIQSELNTLQVQVTTFNDTKNSETFKKIKDDLNKYWSKLQDMKNDEDSIKKSKINLTDKIKKILTELKELALKNEIKLEIERNKLKELRKDIEKCKIDVSKENYEKILEDLAENVKKISDFETLQKEKESLLEELEEMHKQYEESKKSDSVKDSNKAKSIFSQLYSSIEDLTALDDKKPVVKVLEAVRDDLNQKIKELKSNPNDPYEPVYAIPFQHVPDPKEDVRRLEDSSRNSMDNILESIESVEMEYNTTRQKAREAWIKQQQEEIKQQKEITKQKDMKQQQYIKQQKEEETIRPQENKEMQINSIIGVDQKVQNLSKEITNFTSNKQDKQYAEIRVSLQRCSAILNEIPNVENSTQREIQQQINKLSDDLDKKLNENSQNELGDLDQIKSLTNDVKRIKKRIDCFNGLNKSTLYIQIEDNIKLTEQKLNELNQNINNVKLKQLIQTILIKLKQYYKILDEKSIKVNETDHTKRQSYSYDSYKQIEKVRNDLLIIKSEMENYNGTKKEDGFNKLCADLMHCNERLDSIPDLGSKSIKESKEQYTQYIKDLLKYFEEKMTPF